MRVLLLNAAHSVLQNHCISGDIRTTLLLGQHTQLRNGPTVTINDTIAAPPVSLPSQTLSNCLRELENFDSIVGCAFLINDETRLLEEVSEKSKEFLIALRKCFVAKGIADVEKAMLDKASKLVFISLWGGVLKTEARTPYSSCMKSSILCHRVAYSENLLGPESKDEHTSDDIQFIGTTASAKRKRGARASDSDFSHIKSQDVDLRIWSGEGSLVHDFDKNFPAFVMPALDVGVSGKLHGLFTRLEKSNTELHEDIVTELEHCRHLAREYGKDFDLRSGLSSATNRRPTSDCDASLMSLRPS